MHENYALLRDTVSLAKLLKPCSSHDVSVVFVNGRLFSGGWFQEKSPHGAAGAESGAGSPSSDIFRHGEGCHRVAGKTLVETMAPALPNPAVQNTLWR